MTSMIGRRTAQLIAVTALAAVVFLLWGASASAEPAQPPLRLYGTGSAGDSVQIYNADGAMVGETMVAATSVWYVDVLCHADQLMTLTFAVNGESVEVAVHQTGSDQAEITLMMPAASSESTADDDAMMLEGDSMMEDSDDSMMQEDGDDESMMEDGYPHSGTGGLADRGPATAAWVGALAVVGALAAGLGLYRVRRRS